MMRRLLCSFPRLNQCKVSDDGLFHDVVPAVELPHLDNEDTIQRTFPCFLTDLWRQFHFQLPRQILSLKLCVLPDVRRDHPLDLLGLQQQAQAKIQKVRLLSGDTSGFNYGERLQHDNRRDRFLVDKRDTDMALKQILLHIKVCDNEAGFTKGIDVSC
ncbi:hypothetical protein EYF80_050075 [Liparis tanakae]|uniref:Uncharacterized protein n=1 Tax=Liparis tanakae TaxID=230148 RepID=A0A4Z2FEU6_9TELE|nr:hypothetical protein EYF80_050075 [Liparis tanakae]